MNVLCQSSLDVFCSVFKPLRGGALVPQVSKTMVRRTCETINIICVFEVFSVLVINVRCSWCHKHNFVFLWCILLLYLESSKELSKQWLLKDWSEFVLTIGSQFFKFLWHVWAFTCLLGYSLLQKCLFQSIVRLHCIPCTTTLLMICIRNGNHLRNRDSSNSDFWLKLIVLFF